MNSKMKLLSPQLQAFMAVAKHKTVHRAAQALHLTQTAVTQRIKSLERQLETTLFIRTRRGMSLTQEGFALFRYCSEAQELEGEMISSITGINPETNHSLRITGPYTIMHSRIIPQCIPVMREFPRLLLQFDINDNENRDTALRRGECELAVIEKSRLSDEMEYKNLKPEQYILVVSSRWQNRRLRDVIQTERIIDFDPEDQMTFNYLKHFSLFDIANKDRYIANRTDCLAMMIASGIGYGVLPAEFAKPYLASKQLTVLNQGKTYSYQLVLAWYSRHQPPPYFSALLAACE